MLIHEYQAKELFRQYGIPVAPSKPAFSVDEAVAAARELGGSFWAVKAQVHAGGRGKGGGIKLARTLDEVRAHASSILGMTLVTHQTGPDGRLVKRLLIESAAEIAKELYLGIVIDRKQGRPVIMASAEGGVDIEEVAASRPEAIVKETIDPSVGVQAYQGRKLAVQLGLPKKLVNTFAKMLSALYRMYDDKDCSMVEINPLIITDTGELRALDAKVNFDGSGLFRHPEIAALRDLDEEDPIEVRAGGHGLSYVNLTGNIGCMVNGAGLAMSTMDIIKYFGGEPANFLDVGGSATAEAVTEALKLILADERVEAVLVNIFGGIMKCDTIAAGIIAAVREVDIKVPLVVRLEGTNVALGKKMLEESGLALTTADSMADAAEKVVAATRN
ncbi:MAG: ADP-forming succinate--CoA ligase subunit beta [Verrucomicrobia bacterium]|nr:ADP-forming succinate--CoA ligase subunit beta [Verrucomicrobiota bacterium]